MKKGRHRRFEEARKLKQVGPDFLLDEPALRPPQDDDREEDDEYAEIAARYGAFDEDDEDDEDDDTRG